MTPEQLFSIANGVAALAWILLAVLPRQRWVIEIVTTKAVPAFFAILYVGIVGSTFFSTDGGFSTLSGVSQLFSHPWVLLAGWIHYLAFDLLTGSWEVRDAQARGISHWLVVPCLFFTFMFGPAGWLLYMIVRSVQGSASRSTRAAAA